MAFMQHFLDICRILMGLTQQYDIAGIDFRENDQRNFQKFKSPPKIFEDMRDPDDIPIILETY